jgi:hypothetical protein
MVVRLSAVMMAQWALHWLIASAVEHAAACCVPRWLGGSRCLPPGMCFHRPLLQCLLTPLRR